MNAKSFITENLTRTVRFNKTGDNRLIGLPYSYTVPCISDSFQEMYYWDTYFTNKGLILSGESRQAVYNAKNFAYLINEYGFVPNGNITELLNRSQPPFFGAAIKDILPFITAEEKAELVNALKKEYSFWQNERSTSVGLNAYGCSATEKDCLRYCDLYTIRTGKTIEKTVENGRAVIAECESGWDFSPRFPLGCTEYCAVDLNSLLYLDEVVLSELDTENSDEWQKNALTRKEKILKLCSYGGVFFDYCQKTGSVSGVYGCNGFFPYFAGVSHDKVGFEKLLEKLEKPFGIIAAETDEKCFQWASPNGWACLFYASVAAALNVGDGDAAKRIAEKFVNTVNSLYKKDGKLYEKYDVITGEVGASESYSTPEMLGWTAGVYLAFDKFLTDGILI